ncbi:MAG: sigma-70 family RNA polymerase sigma factor [Planctomycetaceae bacterium]
MNPPGQEISESTSTSLLCRVARGDQQAWKEFVGIYSALIYSRCRSRNLSPDDSADVLQNVFIRVHHSISQFRRDRPGYSFRRWLRTITRNAIVDLLRFRAQDPALLGPNTLAGWFGREGDFLDDEATFSVSDGSTELVVRRALDAIRDDFEFTTWQAFWRTAVDDQPAVQVAEELNLNPGTVRQAKYKILRRLRDELQGLFD